MFNWLHQNLPNWAQWLGLFATLAGTGLTVWAIITAQSARDQAELARQAAVRLGRIAQLGDLIAEMQELQIMLIRADFESMAMKCNHLRGRVVRFKQEAYNELGSNESENLDSAREQFEIMGRVASKARGATSTRTQNIQVAYGIAHEALNQALGVGRNQTTSVART